MAASGDTEWRRHAALALLSRQGSAFRATARRCSLCAADADDAFQRAVEILLTRAPFGAGPGHLAAWMQVVTRREALRLRRERERLLSVSPPEGEAGPADQLACGQPGPAERVERREAAVERLMLLARLRPHERRALVLQAQGLSYAEIGALCGWTYTKVNRSLSEGRARLRRLGAIA